MYRVWGQASRRRSDLFGEGREERSTAKSSSWLILKTRSNIGFLWPDMFLSIRDEGSKFSPLLWSSMLILEYILARAHRSPLTAPSYHPPEIFWESLSSGGGANYQTAGTDPHTYSELAFCAHGYRNASDPRSPAFSSLLTFVGGLGGYRRDRQARTGKENQEEQPTTADRESCMAGVVTKVSPNNVGLD